MLTKTIHALLVLLISFQPTFSQAPKIDPNRAEELRGQIADLEKKLAGLKRELDAVNPGIIPPEKRKEIIERIQAVYEITPDMYETKRKLLQDKLEAVASAGINTTLAKNTTPDANGSGKYVFKSVADKHSMIKQIGVEIELHESYPDKVVQIKTWEKVKLGRAEIGSVGWENFLAKPQRIIGKDAATIAVYSRFSGSNAGFGENVRPLANGSQKLIDRYYFTGINTTDLNDKAYVELAGLYYVLGTKKVDGVELKHLVKFDLTDEERKALDPRAKK